LAGSPLRHPFWLRPATAPTGAICAVLFLRFISQTFVPKLTNLGPCFLEFALQLRVSLDYVRVPTFPVTKLAFQGAHLRTQLRILRKQLTKFHDAPPPTEPEAISTVHQLDSIPEEYRAWRTKLKHLENLREIISPEPTTSANIQNVNKRLDSVQLKSCRHSPNCPVLKSTPKHRLFSGGSGMGVTVPIHKGIRKFDT